MQNNIETQSNNLRGQIHSKVDGMDEKQLVLLQSYIESLELEAIPNTMQNPQTNEEIRASLKWYRDRNLPRPYGLAKDEFSVPDDFDDAEMSEEITNLFYGGDL